MLNKICIYEENDKLYTFAYNAAMELEYILQESTVAVLESIYLAKIKSVMSANNLAFVNYQNKSAGLLNLDSKDKLQAGSQILCQMNWRGDGEKLPKFSSQIKHVGRYVILLHQPRNGAVKHAFSKQLKNQTDLAKISQKYSIHHLIFRSSCDKVAANNYNLIEAEINSLVEQDNKIHLALQCGSTGNIIAGVADYFRLVRSLEFSSELSIFTNNADVFAKLKPYVDMWQIDNLNLDPDLTPSLYENDVRQSLASQQKIVSKHGGNFICHKLSGINLIDINSDKTQSDFYTLNYLLCEELVATIKLQDLCGIILIDFVKNMSIKQQDNIINKLSSLLINDWRKSTVLGFTNAGICEIIRSK